MKTLNKTLSLVLVLVMVFSLFGVASAAKLGDFTDKTDVTYTEAVDYLTAASIVAGDTATTINPKGDFTREQAAKLVAYACLGQIAADAMKAPAAPFTDVAADRWSAGYIAYCAKQGIINGMGDGTFAPTAKVTGTQLGKMLLCAIGFGVNGEYTGAGWELSVAKDSLGYGIFAGNTAGANNTTGATREEAFLYTFNTLSTLCNVSYNKALGVYYVPGQTAMNTNPKSLTIGTAFDTREDTVGYQRFKMLKTAGTAADSTYAEATHYWAIDGKKVTGVYANDAIKELASSINGTPYTKLTVKGNNEYIGYSKDETVAYYINGDVKTEADVITATDVKGNKVSFYDTDKNGKYDTVEVLVYTVKKLTAAPTIKTAGGNSVVTIADIGMTNKVDTAITGNFTDLKKDDYVLYYKNSTGSSWTIAKCETLTGQLFGFNTVASQFNINGTTYSFSEITKADGIDFDDISATKGLANTVFYLDAGKNVVAAVPAEDLVAAANVVFVLAGKDDIGTCIAKMLKSDGTVVTKTIDKYTNTANSVVNAVWSSNVSAGKFYTFTENANKNYNLKAIGTATGAAHQITTPTYDEAGDPVFVKGQAKFFYDGTGAAPAKGNPVLTTGTNKTVFVLEGENTKAGTYTAYTGVSAIPNVNAVAPSGTTTAYVLNDKDGYAIMAVALGGDLDNSVLSMDYAFIGMTASNVKMSNTADEYYNYPIVTVNGEVKASGLDATNGGFAPGLIAIDAYDDGKAAGTHVTGTDYLTNASTAQTLIDETRLERVIFNLLDPTNEGNKLVTASPAKDGLKANDLKNVTATGFEVNGNTVKFTSVLGAASALTGDQSFVVTDDVKVFFHDCTEALTTGTITLEKQAGIGVLESLPKTAAGTDTYTYGVSALSVSKDDPTINELYITRYPVKAAGSSTGSVSTADYLITAAADQTLTVNYYTGKAHDAATIVAVIQKTLENEGYTVSKVTLSGTVYTFATKKGVVEINFTWDANDTAKCVESVKVNVDGTDMLLAKTTAYSALGENPGKFIKIGATAAAAAAATPVAADTTTIAAQDGKYILTGYYSVTMAATKTNPNTQGVDYTVTGSGAVTYAKAGAKFNLVITTSGTSTGNTAVTFVVTNGTMVNGAVPPAAANAGMTSVAVSGTNTVTFTPAGSNNAAGVYTIEVTVGSDNVTFA